MQEKEQELAAQKTAWLEKRRLRAERKAARVAAKQSPLERGGEYTGAPEGAGGLGGGEREEGGEEEDDEEDEEEDQDDPESIGEALGGWGVTDVVGEADVAAVVAAATGIPAHKLSHGDDESAKVLALRSSLADRVIGQVRREIRALRMGHSCLTAPQHSDRGH